MSELREQLSSLRAEYLDAGYPGDLADLLPPARAPMISWRRASAMAASLMICIGAAAMVARSAGSGPRLAHFDASDFNPRPAIAAQRPQFDAIVASITPPRPPEQFIDAIASPLKESGRFIYGIGKDLAHRADALIHLV